MKRMWIVFFILSLLPLLSAVELNMEDNFKKDETLMAKVSGNLYQPITGNDVEFYVGHIRTSITANVEKINNEFYIYAQLFGKSPDNYSILIKNVKYLQSGQLVDTTLTQNFTITNITADFSIDKGALITSENFSIEITNLKDSSIEIKTKINNESKNTYTIGSGISQKINFDINDINKTGLSTIELSSPNTKYTIPVYITKITTIPTEKNFRIDPSVINVSMPTNSNTTRVIHIENLGADIENVSFSVSDSLKPYLNLSSNITDEIEYNSSYIIDIFIKSSSTENKLEGQITARSGTTYAYSVVYLNFIKDYVPINGSEETETVIQTCAQINGTLCQDSTKCSSIVKNAKDGVCCLGVCSAPAKKSSIGKYIGWGILIAIIAFSVWFYLRRYKKVQSVSDLTKITKK